MDIAQPPFDVGEVAEQVRRLRGGEVEACVVPLRPVPEQRGEHALDPARHLRAAQKLSQGVEGF